MPKRKCFSIIEKAEIIEKSKVFKGTKVVLKSLGITYFMLQTILKQEVSVELKSEKLGNLSKKRKTLKTSPFEELEKILYEWFKQARAAKIPINGSILKEKALETSLDLKYRISGHPTVRWNNSRRGIICLASFYLVKQME